MTAKAVARTTAQAVVRPSRPAHFVNTMKTIVSLFLLLAFASVVVAAEDARQSREDDVREAVFRWQIAQHDSGQQIEPRIFFLQVGEKDGDPTDEFIKRFADIKPPVQKGSECRVSVSTGALDKKTGKRGLIFRVRSIVWKSDTEVEVKGGYYEGGRSASGNTYTLKKEKEKWKVTNDKMDWIS